MSRKDLKNLYVCHECGHAFVSQDLDDGVTPFASKCLNCPALAKSLMYGIPQTLLGKPAVFWLRPPVASWNTFPVSVQEHLQSGGLIRSDVKGVKKKKKRAFRP